MMRAKVPSASSPEQTPYAAAAAAFAEAKAFLASREAQQMSESDLERELHRLGQELMHKLLQGHREQRDSLAEAADPVEGTDSVDGIERSQRRVPEGHREMTTCATVQAARLTRSSVAPRRRSTSRPPPCTTATSRCGTAHDRPTGRRRGRRCRCPTAAGGIGVIRDRMELTSAHWRLVGAEAVLKLPLQASRDLDACWHFHEAQSTGVRTPSDVLIG